jgi:hypothetical protein
MVEMLSQRAKSVLAVGGAMITLCLIALAASPAAAQASESWTGYCGGVTLNSKTGSTAGSLCQGAARWVDGTMGMGYQHSVCVWDTDEVWAQVCSSGPGAWVYNPGNYTWALAKPMIQNNGYSDNMVEAVAWTLK